MSWLYTLNSSRTSADQRSHEKEATAVRTQSLNDQRPLPVIFGTVDLPKPPHAWFSLDTDGKVTELLALCYGPIDAWLGLHGHAKPIWRGYNRGTQQASATAINLPNLYGGDDGEGGFAGNIFFARGDSNQVMWERVKTLAGSALGENVTPNYRNTAMLFLDRIEHGTAQAIPPYLVRVQRTGIGSDGGEGWLNQYSTPPSLIGLRNNVRLCIALDVSGSMFFGGAGMTTRIAAARKVIAIIFKELHDFVASLSDIFDIELTYFFWAGSATPLSSPVMVSSRSDLLAVQNLIDAVAADAGGRVTGGTRYGPAISRMQDWSTTSSTLSNATNVVLFVTDGQNEDGNAFATTHADFLSRSGSYSGANATDVHAISIDVDPVANLLLADNTPEDGVPHVVLTEDSDDDAAYTLLNDSIVRANAGETELINTFKATFTRPFASMNPVHVVRECLTDRLWGLGIDETHIDQASWSAAAETVFNEEIGISTTLHTDVDVIDFIRNVLRYIDGVVTYRYGDGYRLKLLRRDYDTTVLPRFSTDNSAVTSVSRTQLQNNHNTVDVSFRDIRIESDAQSIVAVSVQDLALVDRDNGVIRQSADYTALTHQTAALQLAERDLTAQSQPLISVTLRAFPSIAAGLNVGDAISLRYDTYDIDIVMRVMALTYGTDTDAGVTLQLLQDVFDTPLPRQLIQTALYNIDTLGRGWDYNWGNEWSGVE